MAHFAHMVDPPLGAAMAGTRARTVSWTGDGAKPPVGSGELVHLR
jgi:hypothetical protein